MRVRISPGAPTHCSPRQAAKASGLHPDIRRFESVREHQTNSKHASESEKRGPRPITAWQEGQYLPLALIRTQSLKPEWRGSGPRLLPGPPRAANECLYPNWQRGNALRARSVLVRVEPGAPDFADRDDRSRSSHSSAIALRCYASGEAARLSIERDGFESRTARHLRSCVARMSVAICGNVPRISLCSSGLQGDEVAGSNPATPTIFRAR